MSSRRGREIIPTVLIILFFRSAANAKTTLASVAQFHFDEFYP
jgi:hypothetical protein